MLLRDNIPSIGVNMQKPPSEHPTHCPLESRSLLIAMNHIPFRYKNWVHNLLSFHPVQKVRTVRPQVGEMVSWMKKNLLQCVEKNGTAARFGTWNAWAEQNVGRFLPSWFSVKSCGNFKGLLCLPHLKKKEKKNDPNREILLLRKLVEQSGFFQRDPS